MTTVLITGAGGVAAPDIIARLKSKYGYRVIATDMNRHASGLYYADHGYVVPEGGSPEFVPAIQNICSREHVDVVVPLVDEELIPMLELETAGVVVVVPRLKFIRTCLDKLELMHQLGTKGIITPHTCLYGDWARIDEMHFPVVLKPRVGRGSRNVHVFGNLNELNTFMITGQYHNIEYIVQPLIRGTEYTVSVVVWRDGEVRAVVPKEIISKLGVTRIAVTRRNDQIDALCRDIQRGLHADGPFNVQLIVEQESGFPIPFEINPRFSTSTSLTTSAGVDEIGVLIQQAIGGGVPSVPDTWREGIAMIRSSKDEFMPEDKFKTLKIDRAPIT